MKRIVLNPNLKAKQNSDLLEIIFLGLVLYAAYRGSGASGDTTYEGAGVSDLEEPRKGAPLCYSNRTAPIVAIVPGKPDQTLKGITTACHGQFKRGGKSSCGIDCAPT